MIFFLKKFDSDEFRGVIMVGLPFANFTSNELNEKMKFISQSSENRD